MQHVSIFDRKSRHALMVTRFTSILRDFDNSRYYIRYQQEMVYFVLPSVPTPCMFRLTDARAGPESFVGESSGFSISLLYYIDTTCVAACGLGADTRRAPVRSRCELHRLPDQSMKFSISHCCHSNVSAVPFHLIAG